MTEQDATTAAEPTAAESHTHQHTPPPLGECEREISVEIPPDVVSAELENSVERFRRMARVPGFRPGKTPASVIRRRFADELRQEVVEHLVPKYFRTEVQKQGFAPISQPSITDFHFHEDEPLRFKARFEILPDIQLAGYDDLKAEKQDMSISDELVESELQGLRENQASYDNVEEDRGLQDGDFAQASFTGTPVEKSSSGLVDATGAPITSTEEPKTAGAQPVHMDDVLIDIGGTNTVQEFSDHLRGAKAGEERKFQITYPDDYRDQRLAGKTLDYTVQIKGIKKKVVPELTDDFARQLGEFKDIEELRGRVREQLEAQRRHEVQHAAKDRLVEQLVERNNFPVPDSLVESQISSRLERGFRALAAQGMREQDLRKMDFARLRAGQRDQAIREVKASLILEKIAEKEKIDAADNEVEAEVERLAEQARQPVETVRKKLDENGTIDRIRERIRNEKTLDFLYQRSA